MCVILLNYGLFVLSSLFVLFGSEDLLEAEPQEVLRVRVQAQHLAARGSRGESPRITLYTSRFVRVVLAQGPHPGLMGT